MPSTITTYHTFVQATKARASQVNTNFSMHRGDLLPIYETTAAASDSVHDLGLPDHRWLTEYVNNIDFKSSTTGAGLILRGDTALTAGAFKFDINSITVAKIGATGMDATYLKPNSILDAQMDTSTRILHAQTFTAAGTFTVPTNVTKIKVQAAGGGGGGGGSGGTGHDGGDGGNGSAPMFGLFDVTPGDVLSITVGAGGAGGVSSGGNGATGGSSIIVQNGTTVFTVLGGNGGKVGATAAAASGFQGNSLQTAGGRGGAANVTGGNGMGSNYAAGGTGGPGGGGDGGGGGGGASWKVGGNGSNGATGTDPTAAAANSGAGGGGGIESHNGASGGSGAVVIYWII